MCELSIRQQAEISDNDHSALFLDTESARVVIIQNDLRVADKALRAIGSR